MGKKNSLLADGIILIRLPQNELEAQYSEFCVSIIIQKGKFWTSVVGLELLSIF